MTVEFLAEVAPSDIEAMAPTKEDLANLIHPPTDFPEVVEPAKNWPVDNLRSKVEYSELAATRGDLFFEAAEHESISYGVNLKNIYGIKQPATQHNCWEVDAFVPFSQNPLDRLRQKTVKTGLKFGRVIALAGDFYSSHVHGDTNRTPISGAFFTNEPSNNPDSDLQQKKDRFISAVKSLQEDWDRNLIELTNLIDKEHAGIEHTQEDPAHHKPTVANVYHHGDECGLPTHNEFWKATMGGKNPNLGLYTWLLYVNADHFGNDAVTCYRVGHSVAMGIAQEAANQTSDQDRANKLQEAYFYEAFCLHYLTDIFSSGHIRTPRRELHTDSYAAASKYASERVTRGKEKPAWDFQSNYMHDNDSSTGLLVQNKKGDQWIAYGDKQFVENWDAVNRARVVHCVQTSVDEIYEAFECGQGKNPADFKALELLPQPMLAAESGPSANWVNRFGGYDMHNPAPLWKVQTEGDRSQFTLRENINDSSLYSRVTASPGPDSPHGIEIRDGSFRGVDAYPKTEAFEYVRTGGFLQVQDLNPWGNQARTCVNFWGPVEVELFNRDSSTRSINTFTLRNRLIDFDRQENYMEETIPLHWAKWHDGKNLSVYRFGMRNDNALVFSQWKITDHCPPTPDLETLVKFSPEHSWAFSADKGIHEKQLSALEKRRAIGHTRYLVGNFSDSSSSEHPDVLSISLALSGPVQTSIYSTVANEAVTHTLDAQGIYQYVKRFKSPGNRDTVLLARNTATSEGLTVELVSIQYSSDLTVTTIQHSFVLPVNGTEKSAQIQVVVGDLLGRGYDQVVILYDSTSSCAITAYALNSDNQFACVMAPFQTPRNETSDVLQAYFTALLPSEQEDGKGIGSILQVSLHKTYQMPSLVFRVTWYNTAEEKWTTTTSLETDDLALDPHYFHLKWIRCTYSPNHFETRNAFLEVFSYYGNLGMRLFAPKGDDSEDLASYHECGRQSFMGQTSIGVGSGAEGEWGNGIITWGGSQDDFLDLTTWTRAGTGNLGSGNWGIQEKHAFRAPIRGWNVKQRPGYHQEIHY